MHQVTIRSVVIAAGVSMSTVSNALSGRYEQIAVETRERVLSPIVSLNYQPNHVARRLVTKRTVPTRPVMSDLTHSLSPPIIPGAEFVCCNAGHSLPLVNTRDLEAEHAGVETIRDKQVEGLLLSVSLLDIANEHPYRAETHW